MLKSGDNILINNEEISISSIEKDEHGCVLINGGLDNEGIELVTDDDTVYYERGYSDVKIYHKLGNISLPVSSDFIYNDASDLEKEQITMNLEDFTNTYDNMEDNFVPNNTTIRVENGKIVSMNKIYMS